MKVKVIKLDDRHDIYEPEKERIGKVYEALKFKSNYEEDENYKDYYALNLGDSIWFMPSICCEVVEEPTIEEFKESLKTKQLELIPNTPDRFLLVEDGSVDTNHLEELGINYILYRSGANKPEWL